MPLYEYLCKECNEEWEAVHTIDTRKEEYCIYCGNKAELLISKTSRPVVHEYFSENLDAYVTGSKHRKQLMKEKGLEAIG